MKPLFSLRIIFHVPCPKWILALLLLGSVEGFGQCDSTSIHDWIRNINLDTVNTIHSRSTLFISPDSSDIIYSYYNKSGCLMHQQKYSNYHLVSQLITNGDTIRECVYDKKTCIIKLMQIFIWDTNKLGVFKGIDEDNYYETIFLLTKYNKYGRKMFEYYTLHTLHKGKKVKKNITIRYYGRLLKIRRTRFEFEE